MTAGKCGCWDGRGACWKSAGSRLLLDVLDLLSDQDLDYAVVGALAATFHGAMRASMDADMVLSVGLPQAA